MEKRKNIKKLLLSAAAVSVLTLAMAISSMAETIPALKDYNVKFTAKEKMESDFKSSDIYKQASDMQPGDSTDIVLNVKNEHATTTDWYMENSVLKSLEDTRDKDALSGGAYTYKLTFKNSSTGEEKTIFSSELVGGDSASEEGAGLHEATDALKDWFYLDTLKNGEGGTLTLHIALDGETQGNDYQDTLAQLNMRFAVELRKAGKEVPPDEPEEPDKPGTKKKTSSSGKTKTKVVKTGDYTNYVPYLIAAGISGLALLLLAIYGLRERRRQRGGKA